MYSPSPVHTLRSPLHNKRFLLTVVLSIGITGYFWSQSRYPQLDHKALMGADTRLEALAFDVLLPTPETSTLVQRIAVNSVNWMYTNRKGMTFGVMLGAILMTLLPLLNGLQFRSRVANSAVGMLLGAPLGLCVNCSTPVAHGLYAAGARLETMLATMISSPTLNVVVLTMLFAMFPPWLALLKIGMTTAFVLVGIPLLTRWLQPVPIRQPGLESQVYAAKTSHDHWSPSPARSTAPGDGPGEPESWTQAGRWVMVNAGRNLWALSKITVPLMFLAGLLGATLVTVMPLDRLAQQLPSGRLLSLLSMGGLAVFGVLLPSPMTFDVIATALLYNAGLPIKYVAVLLFTLGVFSIYPFMTLWRDTSRTMALVLFVVLTLLGVASGVMGNRYYAWDQVRQQTLIIAPFTRAARPPELPHVERTQQGVPAEALLPQLAGGTLQSELIAEVHGLSVSRMVFNARHPEESAGRTLMRRVDQQAFGITEHENYSMLKLDSRYSMARGVASGDVNRDGWPDLVVTSDVGLALYLNRQGTGFVQQRLDIPLFNAAMIPMAALVDLNNDGWLDLWFATLQRGNYVIYNQEGHFVLEHLTPLPNQPDAVLTNAAAFGDLDRDGWLDIVLGNVSALGKADAAAPFRSTRNVWLRQQAHGFIMQPWPGIDGESLSILLSDINQDGWLDLLVGNDLGTPDMIYLSDGQGGLRLVTRADGLIPYSTAMTMSISSADLDNDLIPELYFGAISRRDKPGQPGASRHLTPTQICAELHDAGARTRCERFYHFREVAGHAMAPGEIWECRKLPTQAERDACVAYRVVQNGGIVYKDENFCRLLPAGWDYLSFICHSHFAPTTPIAPEQLAQAIPQQHGVNVLLKQHATQRFTDQAAQLGLSEAGWTWNAKFADLDNDGWQDLFVVNGMVRKTRIESNYFYRNLQGKGFVDATESAGLTSYLNTLSYTYIDFDNDGDLDIIVAPTVGPLSVYVNQSQQGRAIAFELHDQRGNYYGIGSKIIIHYGNGQHQMREIQASGGYISYDAPTVHFGLGETQTIQRVEIAWSTGAQSVLDMEFKAGARYIISRSR